MDAAAPPTLRERSTGGTSDDPPTRKPPQPPPPPHSQRRRRAVPPASDETAGRLRRFLYSLALGAAVAAAFEATGRRYGVASSLASVPAPGSSPPPAQPELLDAPTPPTDAFDPWVYQRDTRKVAFLFVVTKGENGLPHDHLWARFFAGQDPDLYAIHVHVPKTFVFNASTTAAPELFKDTEVRSVVEEKTRSGASLSWATKALLRRALLDEDVARFVTISDACVPVRTFPEVRAYLLDGGQDQGKNIERSFVESSLDPGLRHDVRDAMRSLGIPKLAWRKGSAWNALIRVHATIVAEDVRVFDALKKGCRDDEGDEARVCVVDDHYVPTCMSWYGKEPGIEVRSVTYQNWWPVTRVEPKRYAVQEARDAVKTIRDKVLLDGLHEGNKDVVGGSGSRSCGFFRGGGDRAGTQRPCWLFARKFTERAGRRIGKFAATAVGF